jgi:hypothetical protein
MQQKTSDRGARYQNRLWHSPAKKNQKARDSNSQRGDIVNGPVCQHDYSPRDGTRRGRRYTSDEGIQLRIFRPPLIGWRKQYHNQVDGEENTERGNCCTGGAGH